MLVSNGFYPEISPRSFRATELAKEFCRHGHQVTVITKYRDHDYSQFLQDFPFTLKMWEKPLLPKIPAFSKKPFSLISSVVSRLLLLLFEYPGIEDMFKVKGMLKNEKGYDLMISFAVPFPVQWGVASIHSKRHSIASVWIADCGDSYMFERLDTFKKPFYFKYPEVNFCRKCDYLTVPFSELSLQFYPQFRDKIRVIPQGFNFDEIKLYKGPANYDKPVFVFAGSIIPGKRDLTMFLDFLASLNRDFLFIVYTNQMNWFSGFKQNLDKKLMLNGYIDRLTLIYEMSKVDFLVNIDTVFDKVDNTEAVPSKLIDYALSGRPIMNINSSFLDKELIMEFLDKNYSRKRVIDLSKYDIRKVSTEFTRLADDGYSSE